MDMVLHSINVYWLVPLIIQQLANIRIQECLNLSVNKSFPMLWRKNEMNIKLKKRSGFHC